MKVTPAEPIKLTFVVAGAPKCGTTSLVRILEQHPDIEFSREKEPRFFSTAQGLLDGGPDDGPPRSGRYSLGFTWYEGLWSQSGGRCLGEGSTVYFHSPESPALLKRAYPDARIILMIRDPVVRIYSHYWHEQRFLSLPPFETMWRDGLPAHPRATYYWNISRYASHLARWLHLFPGRVLVLSTGDLATVSQHEMFERLAKFLDLDFTGVSLPEVAPANRAQSTRSRALQRFLSQVGTSGLPARLPSPIYRALRHVSGLLRSMNEKQLDYPPLDHDLAAMLRRNMQDDVEETRRLLGRPDLWADMYQ